MKNFNKTKEKQTSESTPGPVPARGKTAFIWPHFTSKRNTFQLKVLHIAIKKGNCMAVAIKYYISSIRLIFSSYHSSYHLALRLISSQSIFFADWKFIVYERKYRFKFEKNVKPDEHFKV